ncbi:ABC transporter ATP-binding protein [Nocardioides sp. JQ2195]|uniref:ABC transporter ATP-binding protein n=1 Tax=Nocardioides sp. JQ2195 TaxID=2592334 RepID=UPI00143E7560|nr:ABC transporter ATP-binding protein [Nocardioides sp. JQ2195]QIX27725.1 ABC transporter ATP-binding protein [Nocardioides sp. JQ2195]
MSDLAVSLEVPGRVQVDLTADRGDVIAVIGPNGAGKSSLVKAVAGLVPAVGTVVLDGRDLMHVPTKERSLGVVFQDQLLFPHLDARDNVAYGPRARGVARAEARRRADSWLDALGVGELSHRKPSELSGGQAQRVAIARALVTAPDLLLLDEPMSGLDVGVATSLRIELARHLAAFGGIALLVTHDALDALTVANRVLVLDAGRVAQFGTPDEVAQRPTTEHVARLVGLNVIRSGEEFSAFEPSAVTVNLTEPTGSARHRWSGTVAAITPHGAALRLVVRTSGGGPELIADVTPEAATELGLTLGRAVWVSVKATSVRAYTNHAR